MWSPLDPNFIITGSVDSTIRIWKIAYYSPQKKIFKKSYKISKSKGKQNETSGTVNTSVENSLLELTNITSECSTSNVSKTIQSITILII